MSPRKRSIFPFPLFFVSCFAVLIASPKDSAAETDQRLALIRGWLTDDRPTTASATSSQAEPTNAADPWSVYLRESIHGNGRTDEESLRALLALPIPDSLRRIALQDLASDAKFQSRQAQFIRRYGFYAGGFNRLAYVATRVLLGNIQAAGQLGVDAVFAVFGPKQVTVAERRLYKALQDQEREGRSDRRDQDRMAKLEIRVNDALAAVDLERAQWALKHDDPDSANFYARGALGRKPDWSKAEPTRFEAEREIARRGRESVASDQVGYPDRAPPVILNAPDLLRAASSSKTDALEKGANEKHWSDEEKLLVSALSILNGENADRVKVTRDIASTLAESEANEHEADWLRGLLLNPQYNVELRLARAHASRRADLARFIFLGPETTRERAYTLSSRLAQMWNALSGVGVFYVFETAYRGGIAYFSPPPPADEPLDATAEFLRLAPSHPDSPDLARRLARVYEREGRFDQSRALLKRFDLLDAKKDASLTNAEARRILSQAELLPPDDPRREAWLKKVMELVPDSSLSATAERQMKRNPRRGDKIEIRISWETFRDWFGDRLPPGTSLRTEWFDGESGNGEVEQYGIAILSEGSQPAKVQLRYGVQINGEHKVIEQPVALSDDSSELQRWIRFCLDENDRNKRGLRELNRLPFPFEITGGAGLSGVDFYPRLLPIEIKPNERALYQD